MAAVPDPATSGGDVSGFDVSEALIPIELEPIVFDYVTGLPADVDDPIPRAEAPSDPDQAIADALVQDLSARLNAALATDDAAGIAATLLPGLLTGRVGDACQQTLDSTIAQADSVAFASDVGPPDTSAERTLYTPTATINYPTGSVAWGAVLLPGPQGRLFMVLPSCV